MLFGKKPWGKGCHRTGTINEHNVGQKYMEASTSDGRMIQQPARIHGPLESAVSIVNSWVEPVAWNVNTGLGAVQTAQAPFA